MKNILLKTILIALFLLTGKVASTQSLNAKFGYSINCRTVTFTDSTTTTGGIKVDYCDWDFGDGGTNTLIRNPTHIFIANGTYTVTMVARSFDSTLGSYNSTTTRNVVINCNVCNINTNFSMVKDPVIDKKMIFTNQTSGQTTYTSIWNFGYTGNGGSTLKNPSHNFPSNGYYNVKLITSYYDSVMAKTCKDSITRKVSVNQLRANFGYTFDTAKCSKVTFSDSSKGYPNLVTWQFSDFDSYYTFDSTSTYGKNPVFMYPVADSIQVFNVTYVVKYIDSSTSSFYYDTMRKQITIPACTKCMINAVIDLQGDSTKAFTGTLYNSSTGNINKHYWNFGDGGSSTSNAPVHSYTNPGTYTITYIARDTLKNCSDTARVTFTIDSSGFLKRQAFVLTVIDKTSTSVKKVNNNYPSKLKIYPNPTNGLINIEMDKDLNFTVMKLINSIGQIVYSGPAETTFDLGRYPSGNYALLFIGDEGKFVIKLIRE